MVYMSTMVSQDSETVDSPAAIAGAGPAKGKDRSDLLVLLGLATCVGLAMVAMLNIVPGDPCERDMLTECTQLSVARWHENGDREALARMISSCEWYVPACQHLSEIASDLEAGTHGPRDLETASKLYRIACDSKFEQQRPNPSG